MLNSLKFVAEKIIKLRESQNLTQEQLAEKANISLDELKKIESADPSAHINEYACIGTILNFKPNTIFAEFEKQHKKQINSIKKLLQKTSLEFLTELETHIKTKLKIK